MADPRLTEAQQLEFDVHRLVVIAKARRRWRQRMLGRALGSWIMVYRPER